MKYMYLYWENAFLFNVNRKSSHIFNGSSEEVRKVAQNGDHIDKQ